MRRVKAIDGLSSHNSVNFPIRLCLHRELELSLSFCSSGVRDLAATPLQYCTSQEPAHVRQPCDDMLTSSIMHCW